MRVLWLSWRDIKNPDSGGAEKVAIEITSRLAKDGHDVTIFTSSFKLASSRESHGKVKIIRRGNRLTCRFWAFLYYLNNKDFDLIVDEINTIPFFSALYARKKSIALVHQTAKEYWFSQTTWPLSVIGYLLESPILKLYRNQKTLTVSASTSKDLKDLGFRQVDIIREGLDFKPLPAVKKENLILYLGRLTKPKGVQDAIYAFSKITKFLLNYEMVIIGKGSENYTRYLKKNVVDLGLSKKIKFTEFIKDSEKINFLKKAKIILIPSIREGWNLVAVEAMACGCVPIAYNVAGLKDSIKNNQTGILVAKNPEALVKAAISVLTDEKLRKRLAQNGVKEAQKFSWENTYKDFTKVLAGRFSKVSR